MGRRGIRMGSAARLALGVGQVGVQRARADGRENQAADHGIFPHPLMVILAYRPAFASRTPQPQARALSSRSSLGRQPRQMVRIPW